MQRKIFFLIGTVLVLALIGTVVWGYQERKEKNTMIQRAENQYQGLFHELSNNMDKLEDELGKTLALNSKEQLSASLLNAWRLCYSAQGNINQLPLQEIPIEDVERFLNHAGTFAYNVSARDLNQNPLNEQEYKILQTLYHQARQIQDKTMHLQSEILKKPYRWMDAEKALIQVKKNSLVDGVRQVNHLAKSYPEMDYGRTVNNAEVNKRQNEAKLKGGKITASQAKEVVRSFLGVGSTEDMSVSRNAGGNYQTYSVQYKGLNGVKKIADVSVIGGHIVWMEATRKVSNRNLSIVEADQKGRQFLDRNRLKNMVAISYSEVGNIMTLTYVKKDEDVYIYPQTIAIKVALDNGEILGYDGDEFLFNQVSLSTKRPTITLDALKRQVNPHLQINKIRLALIYSKEGKEVFCYEVLGSLSRGDQYRLFINAYTGQEEFIEKIKVSSFLR